MQVHRGRIWHLLAARVETNRQCLCTAVLQQHTCPASWHRALRTDIHQRARALGNICRHCSIGRRIQDHLPCPLEPTYQLVRNALAAAVAEDGSLEPDRGHALILYDARNPAVRGDRQSRSAVASRDCGVPDPGLLRRLSWQQLLVNLDGRADLSWLTSALKAKYGLVPADRPL